MSSKKTYNAEKSSSGEYENNEQLRQVNGATPKRKSLYRSISNGMKMKISCVNPNVLDTPVDHEYDTPTIKTSSNTRSLEPESNDTSTTNDLISHKKNSVSRKRKCSYFSKRIRKNNFNVDSDVETSVVTGDNTQRVITSCEKRNIERSLDDSENMGECIMINSDDEDNLTNHDLTVPKKKKLSKKKKHHSKLKKRNTCDVVPVREKPVVHEDDIQEYPIKVEEEEEPYFKDSEKIGEIKQSSEVNSEIEEKLTDCNSTLPSKDNGFSKQDVYCAIPEIMESEICCDSSNSETSVAHEDNAKVHISSNSKRRKIQKTPLDNAKSVGEIQPIIEDNSESNDILTTHDFMLPIKKRGRSLDLKVSRKKINYIDSDVILIDVHQDDTQKFKTSYSKNIEVESPLENSKNFGEFEQSSEVSLKDEDMSTKNNLNLSTKKIAASKKSKFRSISKKTKRKIYNIDHDIEKSVINNDDSQMFKISNNSISKESEFSLNESEQIRKSQRIEKLTTDDVIKKNDVIPKKRVRFSISDVAMEDISNVNSNLKTQFIHEDNTSVFKVACNTRNMEQKSSLDDNLDSGDNEPIIESKLNSEKISATNDSILPPKKKTTSKKRLCFSTPIRKKRKVQNVNFNVETLVTENGIQSSKTHNNKRTVETIEQKSLLNDTENINVEQSIAINPESSEIYTTDALSLSLQKKSVPRKRSLSISNRKKKKLSNTSITAPEESKTNNPKLSSGYLTIHEFQPKVLVEVLSNSPLKKKSNKNLKTANKNFDADKQSLDTTYEPLKPMLKTKDTLNCKVSPCSSSNLESSSLVVTCLHNKIKEIKSVVDEKGSNMQKYSSLSKHDKSSEEYDVENSETNKLLEPINEKTDSSQISSSETTTINPDASIQVINNEKIQLSNTTNRNSGPASILKNLVKDIDWIQVDSNQSVKIDSLQKEVDLLDHVHQLRSALRTTHANYEVALEILQKLYNLDIDAFMLIKNTDVIDTIVKVTKYIGNASEWNVTEQEVLQHAEKARQIRHKAQLVFHMFRSLFTVPDGQTFQEVYNKEVNNFMAKTKNKNLYLNN